ncbi:MAG TPA: hypothetical protein VI318_18830 [Baekduia sp.]
MHALHRSAAALALAAFASLTLAAPHARADVSGADIVGFVNAQRAANGIPAGIVEDAAASAACAAWIASGEHDAGPAGEWSWEDYPYAVDQGPWTAANDPFERHPYQLPLVLAPRLATLGAAEVNGRGCATLMTLGTRPAPAHDVTYTYPGDGMQDVRTSQLLDTEIQPTDRFDESGPVLYAFFDGPDLDPADTSATKTTSASLTGPGGAAVAVDAHDFSTPFLPTEVQLVPRAALAPFTTYHASVSADVTPPGGGAARSFTRAWSFTTGALENAMVVREYSDLDSNDLPTGIWTLGVGSRAPQVTLTATGAGQTITQTAPSPDYWTGARFTVPLAPGAWHVCFTSGGPGTDYRPVSVCESITSVGAQTEQSPTPPAQPPTLAGPAPKPTKVVASLAHGAKASLRGRVLSLPIRCSAACTLKVAGTVTEGRKATRLRSVTVKRKTAGTVTVKYTLSKAAARRLRAARSRRLTLTIVPKGGATVRKTLAISAPATP